MYSVLAMHDRTASPVGTRCSRDSESSRPAGRLPGALSGRRFGALRHRNYRIFITGQLVSLVGTWLQSLAQSWLVYRLTGSAALLGIVGFYGSLPVLFAAPLGGMIGDRWPRRRALMVTQATAAALACSLGILTLSGHVTVTHIIVIAALTGVVSGFDIPIRQSFVVEMVGRDDLPSAIALNSSAVNGARILGPAVGGILVAAVGEGWCFVLNAASFLAVLASLTLIRVPPRARARTRATPLRAIMEGFRCVAESKSIRALLGQLGFISLLGVPYAVLMPIFADGILHGGPKGLGVLMGAVGLGALAAALRLAARGSARGLSSAVSAASAGFGLFLVLFAWSEAFWLSAVLLMVVGFCFMTVMAGTNTLVQTICPDDLRSRVMSVYTMMFVGMSPFGALVAGYAAARFGAPSAVATGGLLCLIVSFLFARYLPILRASARREIAARDAGPAVLTGGV